VDALELTRLATALDVPLDYVLEPRPTVISHRAELITEDSDTETARREPSPSAWTSSGICYSAPPAPPRQWSSASSRLVQRIVDARER
jgi:hypothetical protein